MHMNICRQATNQVDPKRAHAPFGADFPHLSAFRIARFLLLEFTLLCFCLSICIYVIGFQKQQQKNWFRSEVDLVYL